MFDISLPLTHEILLRMPCLKHWMVKQTKIVNVSQRFDLVTELSVDIFYRNLGVSRKMECSIGNVPTKWVLKIIEYFYLPEHNVGILFVNIIHFWQKKLLSLLLFP